MGWLPSFHRRKRREQELDSELRFHFEQQVKDNVASGMSPAQARREASIEFGGLDQIRESCRDEWSFDWLAQFARDIQIAARSLRKNPGFTITVLLIIAVCMAANVTIFSVVNRVLIRPLSFRDPGQLVTVFDSYPKGGVMRGGVSPLHYLERKQAITAFADAGAWISDTATFGGTGQPERVDWMGATPSFFRLLGVNAALGRTFTEEEGTNGKDHVVVLSDELWRQHFNADPAAIGRTIRLDAIPTTVIGVMPPSFHYLSQRTKLWTPLTFSGSDFRADQRYRTGMEMIARLRPGVTVAEAQAQVDALNAHPIEGDSLAKLAHEMGFHTVIRNLHSDYVTETRPVLLLLQTGVLLLLVIGAVNLSNLVMVRATGRTKEFRVRQALGASRFQLTRSLVVETLLLSVGSAVFGLGLGAAALRGIAVLVAERWSIEIAPGIDVTVYVAALGASVVLGLVLAAPVIWHAIGTSSSVALAVDFRGGTTTRAVHRMRHFLIIAQIALAFMLLAGTGLLGLSFVRMLSVHPGFRSDNVLTGAIALPWETYPEPKRRLAFLERLIGELRVLPGVTSVGICTRIPFSGSASDEYDFTQISIEGRKLTPDEAVQVQYNRGVTGDYFGTLGIPLQAGRFLSDDDSRDGKRVCVIDESLAKYYWPRGGALGHRLAFGVLNPTDKDYLSVVGIVGSVTQNDLASQHGYGAVYYPNSLLPPFPFMLAIRTAQAPESVGPAVRAAILRIDPELPLYDLKAMTTRVDDSLASRRIPVLLGTIFAAVALMLAAMGIYGVLAYSVVERRREIGVRIALGAQRMQILWQFLALGLRLLAIGLPIGLIGAWLIGRAMAALLFGVAPADPIVLASTAVVLGAVAMLACLLPARRATGVAPSEALRAD